MERKSNLYIRNIFLNEEENKIIVTYRNNKISMLDFKTREYVSRESSVEFLDKLAYLICDIVSGKINIVETNYELQHNIYNTCKKLNYAYDNIVGSKMENTIYPLNTDNKWTMKFKMRRRKKLAKTYLKIAETKSNKYFMLVMKNWGVITPGREKGFFQIGARTEMVDDEKYYIDAMPYYEAWYYKHLIEKRYGYKIDYLWVNKNKEFYVNER